MAEETVIKGVTREELDALAKRYDETAALGQKFQQAAALGPTAQQAATGEGVEERQIGEGEMRALLCYDVAVNKGQRVESILAGAKSGVYYGKGSVDLAHGWNGSLRIKAGEGIRMRTLTPLGVAAEVGSDEAVLRALVYGGGADVNRGETWTDGKTGRAYEISPLTLACMQGRSAAALVLLDLGADMSMYQAETPMIAPLGCAALRCQEGLVRAMLLRGANPNMRCTVDGETPLHLACQHSAIESPLEQFTAGAREGVKRAADAPTEADVGNLVAVLLDAHADPNAQSLACTQEGKDDVRGTTPLMFAAYNGNITAVRLLLKRGAKELINHRRECDGSTAVMAAVNGCRADILLVLLDAGADADIPDADGRTPLMVACGNGYHHMIAPLVINGRADPNAVHPKSGMTAVDFAAKLDMSAFTTDVTAALVAHGGDPDRARDPEFARCVIMLHESGLSDRSRHSLLSTIATKIRASPVSRTGDPRDSASGTTTPADRPGNQQTIVPSGVFYQLLLEHLEHYGITGHH